MKRNCVLLLTVLFVLSVGAELSFAGVPLVLSHQGRLLDASDQPVSGTRDITFRIYDSPTGGTLLWTESHLSVPVTNGLFKVGLGVTVPLTYDILTSTSVPGSDIERYLSIQVAADAELLPRLRIGSSAFSVASGRVTGDIETHPGELDVPSPSGVRRGSVSASNFKNTVELTESGEPAVVVTSDPDVSSMELRAYRPGRPTYGNITFESSENRDILKTYFETGDIPTESQFTSNLYGATVQLHAGQSSSYDRTVSLAADTGGSEVKVKHTPLGGMSGSTTGTIRVGHGGGGGGGIGGDAFTVIGTFEDGTSEDVTEMKVARKDITINLRHHDQTGVNGDQESEIATDSGGSEVRLSSGPLSGMSGSTTATIRTGATSGGGGGGALEQAYTATGRFSDGVTESSVEQGSSSSKAYLAIKEKGGPWGPGGRVMLESSDSSYISCEYDDADLDDVSEARGIIVTKPSGISGRFTYDGDDDGFPESRRDDDCDGISARSVYIGRTGSTTGTIRMAATGDSVDHEITVEDPLTSTEMKVKEKANKTKCSSNLRSMTPTDSMDIEHSCDLTSAASRWKGMSGSTTGTIRMMASPDSAVSYLDHDDDGDGFSEGKISGTVRDQLGNVVLDLRLEADSDDDGVADNEAELHCDTDGARSILSGHSGSTTGTIRMSASPDSTVFDLSYSGSTTATIRMQADASGVSNPIEHSSGAHLTAGGDWTNASDKNLKENFSDINGEEILEKIENLPISQWNYKTEDESVTHIGPTAQDFKKAFNVGADDKTISTIDPSGIALAAIKELIKQNQDLMKANEELNKRVKALEKNRK